MKYVFISDLHGSAYAARFLPEIDGREQPEKIILLGDLLYHGPRNDLPREYDTKEVTKILNAMKTRFLCVRGNCDAEVDQMVLEFPIMADFMPLRLGSRTAFVTHGHLYNTETLPPMNESDLLIHGHTHLKLCVPFGNDNFYLNPGSTSIPKDDDFGSYMVWEDGVFIWKKLDGTIVKEEKL